MRSQAKPNTANWYDFHGGGILEWGSHTVDLCQWAAKVDDTQPVEYEPEGGNTGVYAVHCRYANGVRLEMLDEGWNGRLNLGSCTVRFEGDNGWVETGDTGKVETSENLRSEIRPTTAANLALAYHMQDWLNCVKSRTEPCRCSIIMSPPNCNETLSPLPKGEGDRVDDGRAETGER